MSRAEMIFEIIKILVKRGESDANRITILAAGIVDEFLEVTIER